LLLGADQLAGRARGIYVIDRQLPTLKVGGQQGLALEGEQALGPGQRHVGHRSFQAPLPQDLNRTGVHPPALGEVQRRHVLLDHRALDPEVTQPQGRQEPDRTATHNQHRHLDGRTHSQILHAQTQTRSTPASGHRAAHAHTYRRTVADTRHDLTRRLRASLTAFVSSTPTDARPSNPEPFGAARRHDLPGLAFRQLTAR